MIKILSEHNRYDGMISGTCLYRGEVCWFSCTHLKDIFVDPRVYRIFELSKWDRFRLRLGDFVFEKIVKKIIHKSPKTYKRIHRIHWFLYNHCFSIKSEKSLKIIGAFNENEYYRS